MKLHLGKCLLSALKMSVCTTKLQKQMLPSVDIPVTFALQIITSPEIRWYPKHDQQDGAYLI